MKETSITEVVQQNEFLHKKLDRYRELVQIYRTALRTYARKYPELNNMNAAEKALEDGKKLEKLL